MKLDKLVDTLQFADSKLNMPEFRDEFPLMERMSHDLGHAAYSLRSIFAELEAGYFRPDQNLEEAILFGKIQARRLERVLYTVMRLERHFIFNNAFSLNKCFTELDELTQWMSTLDIPIDINGVSQKTLRGDESMTSYTIGNILYWLISQTVNEHITFLGCLGLESEGRVLIQFLTGPEIGFSYIDNYIACIAAESIKAELYRREDDGKYTIELLL
jgi:hypothetical protein